MSLTGRGGSVQIAPGFIIAKPFADTTYPLALLHPQDILAPRHQPNSYSQHLYRLTHTLRALIPLLGFPTTRVQWHPLPRTATRINKGSVVIDGEFVCRQFASTNTSILGSLPVYKGRVPTRLIYSDTDASSAGSISGTGRPSV